MTTPPGANHGNEDPGNHEDDTELINAEFESMVAGLSLDQSSPRTYLDELDEIEREEAVSLNSERALYAEVTEERIPLHLKLNAMFEAVKKWWNGENRNDGEDGARL
jgi:hypothetical protein